MGVQNQVEDIKQTLIYNAPIQKVWEVVSTSEGISAWFMPNDFKPVVGHEFHLQGPFGPSPCKVLEIDEPNRVSFTWDVDGWVVSFHLKDLGDQTEFTLIHSGWKTAEEILPKPNQKSGIVRDNMNGGWAGIVQKLKKVVEY
ncbi:SRPBCC family protein [Gottfriedia acidiceleris]|uniref:SRPBCC domain-containing protein n=1 Tax=Gottfriedia acidiceleris TaxID=371036 RepID=A0ABY4JID6_9BACI|nr:SRPBCC domain-containing protein [Gottfriedia acidiceleris]UPM53592.1 SRPBCC domain-containing protein [Gottfriedia acidiceleris]